jgi:ABC-type Fe3+/spermidine/putrescine transport system ATPase subunit
MNNGVVEQAGSPLDIYQSPQTAFTARFLGCSNVFAGHVAAIGEAGRVVIDVGENLRLAGCWRSREPARADEKATIAFRADRVAVRPAAAPAGENGFAGEIETAAFLGNCFDYTVRAGALQVQAEGPIDHPFARGQTVSLSVPSDQCHAFRAATEV